MLERKKEREKEQETVVKTVHMVLENLYDTKT